MAFTALKERSLLKAMYGKYVELTVSNTPLLI
jgi:hypothetical protein